MKSKKIISVFLMMLTLFTMFTFSASALTWDGSSAGGSTNAVNGSSKGYVIRDTNDSNCVVGYRFSVVNSSGGMKVSKVMDVYRNTTNGNHAYSSSAKFSTKYNKKQMIANKNAKLTTTSNTTDCYKENDMSFLTALPNPSGIETWQAYENNINKVLTKIGVGTTANMIYGDKVIIEPLFDVCLAGEYQALTVSEIAYCGRSVKGGSSDGGTSNGTSSTWGFIANYTNRIWPNKLYTPNGQGLWTAALRIADGSKETFENILTKGYGAGIAYNETANITYTIKFDGNGSTSGSTASMSMIKDVSKNLTANGFKKTGNKFVSWNTKADGTGTKYTDKQSVKNLSSKQGATVTLYAQWSPYTLTVAYNCTGSSVTVSDTSKGFSLGTSNRITTTTENNKTIDGTKNVYYQSFKYNSELGGKGLHNFGSFGLSAPTGYRFVGWKCGSTTFDDDITTYKPTDFTSDIKTGDATVWITAKFSPNTYSVKFNGNGSTSGSMSNQFFTYDTAKALSANAFKREFTVTYNYNGNGSSNTTAKATATFGGWAKSATGSKAYDNSQSVKKLSSTNGATVNLYAKWTDGSVTLPTPTRTGYSFSGWYTVASGGTKIGDASSSYTPSKNITLYAHWTPITYTIKFDKNGATRGSTASMSMTYDVAQNLTANGFTWDNHKWIKWNTKADGLGTSYTNKQSVKNLTTVQDKVITLYAQWEELEEEHPLSLEPIMPNADYREGTDVITSFNIINNGKTDCTPDKNVSVVFTVNNGETAIRRVTLSDVVVPANDKNLLFFKWTVPNNIGVTNVSISGEIVINGKADGYVCDSYNTCKYTISETPDTQYEIGAPDGFSKPSVPANKNNSATWEVWEYENGSFKTVKYGIAISDDNATLTPAASANASKEDGIWIMKSGYGVELSTVNAMKSVSGTVSPNTNSYTTAQYSIASFPEFGYLKTTGNYRTLELVSGKWILRENGSYGRIHFTPLWYPDGSYSVNVTISDCWTPAGMITRTVNTNTVTIKGSAYDDWTIS